MLSYNDNCPVADEKNWSADVLSGRHIVRMTFRQDGLTTLDVLSGLCLTTLDVLSGRIHVRRFVRKTVCHESEWPALDVLSGLHQFVNRLW